MKRLLALLLTLGVLAGATYAHNGMQHIMGTVTSITDVNITVKASDGKIQTVALSSDTRYSKANAAVEWKDIKVGDHIVIHATKKGDQFIAAEVKVGMIKIKSDDMDGMKMNKSTAIAPAK